MNKIIIIEADMNDGDYVEKHSPISDENLEKFMPLIEAIKKEGSYNWQSSEYEDYPPEEMYKEFGSELIEEFQQYVPRGEYGIHTIEEITVYTVTDEQKLIGKYDE